MHSKGYAHLDIKTNNILLREPLNDENLLQAVLVDFGAAQKAVRRAEVEAGALVYLPPERVRVMRGDAPPESVTDKAAADIYSLGIVLYRMLAGRLPFQGRKDEVTTAILNQAPTTPSSYNANIRSLTGLDDLILEMLDKQPERRPKAGEIIDRLERLQPSPRLETTIEDIYVGRGTVRTWQRIAAVFFFHNDLGGARRFYPSAGWEFERYHTDPDYLDGTYSDRHGE